MSVQLVIGIPTYNRGAKLGRTIEQFRAQIAAEGLSDRVSIRVHDNGSTDATPEVCARACADAGEVRIAVHRHPVNVGFNRNVWSLYERSDGDYLWTFADDDLIFPNTVRRVLEALDAHTPDMLLFSFIQPPGSSVRTFDFPESVHVARDPGQCVRLAWRQPKISQYVYSRRGLSPASRAMVEAEFDRGAFAFIAMAFSILLDSPQPCVAVISEPQATCDDDFLAVRFSPNEWGRFDSLLQHPFALRHAPELGREAPRVAWRSLLSILWSWRAGTVQIEQSDETAWWEAIGNLKPRWRWLAESPGDLLRFTVLKTLPGYLPRGLTRVARGVRAAQEALRRRV